MRKSSRLPNSGKDAAAAAGKAGAGSVKYVEEGSYSLAQRAATVEGVIKESSPGLVLMSANTYGKELAGVLAARLQAGFASECTEVRFGDDGQPQTILEFYSLTGDILGSAWACVGMRGR